MDLTRTVQVTKKHIDNGRVGCRHCPVALAMKDAFPEYTGPVKVGATGGRFVEQPDNFFAKDQGRFVLPQTAQDFIRDFDYMQGCGHRDPFEFVVTVYPTKHQKAFA